MVKKLDAFELALRQLSLAQLKKLAAMFKKNTSHCDSREDFVNRLAVGMKPAERVKAMQEFILAGQTSMTIYALDLDKSAEPFSFEPEFKGTASREPVVVTVGEPSEIIEGQQLIQWAVVTGQQHFLDVHLSLKEEPESMVVDTFFEEKTGYLQIRASSLYAKRIAMHWARLAGTDFASSRRICLGSVADVDAFATQLGGTIRKCAGDKKESNGFLRVSGTRHPNTADLRGSKDYAQFLEEVDPADFQIEFEHEKKGFSLGISIDAGSLFFMSNTPEKTIQYVYRELKKYLRNR